MRKDKETLYGAKTRVRRVPFIGVIEAAESDLEDKGDRQLVNKETEDNNDESRETTCWAPRPCAMR